MILVISKFLGVFLIVILLTRQIRPSEVSSKHIYNSKQLFVPKNARQTLKHSYEPKNIYPIDSYLFKAYLYGLFTLDSDLAINPAVIKATLILATEEASKLFPNIQFNLKFYNSTNNCLNHNLGAHAAEEFYLRKVTAFIGPACSFALNAVARMAAYWNVPILTAGGISENFKNKNIFSSLVRLAFSTDRLSRFLIKILREYDWHHLSIIVDESDVGRLLLKESIERDFRQITYTNTHEIKFNFFSLVKTNETFTAKKLLQDSSKVSRVIILLVQEQVVRDILLEAYDLGMHNGEYTFIGIELIRHNREHADLPWFKVNDSRNKEARMIYEAYMTIAVRVPTSPQYNSYKYKVVKVAENKLGSRISVNDVNPLVAAFYDCILLYGFAINTTLTRKEDPLNGTRVIKTLWNTTWVQGLSGEVHINTLGDREVDYTLNDIDPVTGVMTPVGSFYGEKEEFLILSEKEIHWPNGSKSAPLDVPLCGFTGDAIHCTVKEPLQFIYSVLISLFILTLIGGIAAFLILKKLRLESNLSDYWWKVKWEDLIFAQKPTGKRSTLSLGLNESSFLAPTNQMSTFSVEGVTFTNNEKVCGTLIAVYKGHKVSVKMLEIKKFNLNRTLLIQLKQMRDVTHENLARFTGICIESPNFCVINELAMRGRLRDLLENDSFKIDLIFKYAMITDILEGLSFLHNSEIGYHGRLSSSNCIINERFTVKLAGYGIREFYKQVNQNKVFNSRKLFWTAPEHLRQSDPFLSGSQKGDIYSFSIIIQEIITRTGPFESIERLGRKRVHLEPDEILDRLRICTIPPFRPEVAPDEAPSDLIDLMHDCWHESPDARPDLVMVKSRLKKITKGVTNKNFLDNLLNRMEQYTSNLEQMVEEKSRSFIEEKKKTEELLYQLLPKFIAEQLKAGNTVKPEAFECVTIFFSDIVEFTSLSSQSTPMEVVDFLNDLYTCFDAIISNYDVYKVETIGDAYMVASGLPVKNGNEHAREIARMSLNLRETLKTFKIRHKPEKQLLIRIGLHSGPCVAGVVGLKMPKYCLFGDTVNTASRMETNGEPLMIHMSKATKDILENFKTFLISPRGQIEVKGKGLMETFWLDGELEELVDS